MEVRGTTEVRLAYQEIIDSVQEGRCKEIGERRASLYGEVVGGKPKVGKGQAVSTELAGICPAPGAGQILLRSTFQRDACGAKGRAFESHRG